VEFLKQTRVESQAAHDTSTGQAAKEGMGTDSNSLSRDYSLEWKLIQKADPETAKAWEAEAAQKVQ
jgi:hypothetical protein